LGCAHLASKKDRREGGLSCALAELFSDRNGCGSISA
jgi:hypothetical protein